MGAKAKMEEIVSTMQSVSPGSAVAAVDVTGKNAARKEILVALGVGAVGVAVFFGGVVAFLMRVKLAEFVLGARVWFGVPVDDIDTLKVLAMTIHSLLIIVWGAGTAGVSFVYAFFKWTRGLSQS